MADRPPPVTRPSASRPARNPAAQSVKRNLFQSQLTRRPTPTSSSNSAETLRLDIDVLSDTSEIVIRDKNGEFEVGDPPIPPMEEPEVDALDDAQEHMSEWVRHNGHKVLD
jgi:hypothetical protein